MAHWRGFMEKDKSLKCKKYNEKCIQGLPVLAGAFSAILTEGKTVKEMETLALFLAALSNNILLIASIKDKNDTLVEDFPELPII